MPLRFLGEIVSLESKKTTTLTMDGVSSSLQKQGDLSYGKSAHGRVREKSKLLSKGALLKFFI
jgi:hypothetical protein